jgi:perosamine synthetase
MTLARTVRSSVHSFVTEPGPMTDELLAMGEALPVRPEGPPGWPLADPDVVAVLTRLAQDGSWGRYHGPHTERLAALLRDAHQIEHAWLCSSGTAAVELALRGVGLQPGDEVVLAAYDFKANFTNVLMLGAVPVLVDIDEQTRQLDVRQLPDAVSEKTRAILVSHLHGGVVDLGAVRTFAAERRLAVIEDACQCPGITIGGRTSGAGGDVGVLSFGGSKLVTSGRGGAVVTARTDIYERIRRHVLRGNDAYPLSEMQAAVIVPQWLKLSERHQQRAAFVRQLLTELGPDGGLVAWQWPTDSFTPGYYKVGFEYDPAVFSGLSRAGFCHAIRGEGIAIDPGFRALHRIHGTRRFRAVGALPQADRADDRTVTLHHPVLLESQTSLQQILVAVRKIRQAAERLQAAEIRGATRPL